MQISVDAAITGARLITTREREKSVRPAIEVAIATAGEVIRSKSHHVIFEDFFEKVTFYAESPVYLAIEISKAIYSAAQTPEQHLVVMITRAPGSDFVIQQAGRDIAEVTYATRLCYLPAIQSAPITAPHPILPLLREVIAANGPPNELESRRAELDRLVEICDRALAPSTKGGRRKKNSRPGPVYNPYDDHTELIVAREGRAFIALRPIAQLRKIPPFNVPGAKTLDVTLPFAGSCERLLIPGQDGGKPVEIYDIATRELVAVHSGKQATLLMRGRIALLIAANFLAIHARSQNKEEESPIEAAGGAAPGYALDIARKEYARFRREYARIWELGLEHAEVRGTEIVGTWVDTMLARRRDLQKQTMAGRFYPPFYPKIAVNIDVNKEASPEQKQESSATPSAGTAEGGAASWRDEIFF